MMCKKAVEGDWLILDYADRFKIQPRLVMTGAIVIGRCDGFSRNSLPVTIQMRSKASWRTTTGRADYWDVLNESKGSDCWSVLIVGSSMMRI